MLGPPPAAMLCCTPGTTATPGRSSVITVAPGEGSGWGEGEAWLGLGLG